MKRAGFTVALGGFFAVALPPAAPAAEVHVGGGNFPIVSYTAEDGEKNEIAMAAERGGAAWSVFIEDDGPLSAGAGCVPVASGASCQMNRRPTIDVELGDRGDRFDGAGLAPIYYRRQFDNNIIDGGAGPDHIVAFAAFHCPYGQAGNDSIRLLPYEINIGGMGYCLPFGGSGNDHIIGTEKIDYLEGNGGRDTLKGRGRGDELDGGGGGDELIGGTGPDTVIPGRGGDLADGGADNDLFEVTYGTDGEPDGRDRLLGRTGQDTAFYRCGGCRISFDGEFNDGLPGESDNVEAERVNIISRMGPTVYGPGDDVVRGAGKNEKLQTSRGDDKLIGGRGSDLLLAGPDDDEVRAADGEPDEIECGNGEDVATIDQFDKARACETVNEVIFD